MVFADAFIYLWNLFVLWVNTLFVLPIKNTDMLWILVPLWLSWFFSEFFQEKLGTSFGNAISNAVVVLWAGVDCIRQTLRLISAGDVFITSDIITRFILCGLLLGYGIVIIIYGYKVKEKVKIFGRIRDVTYAFVIFVPVLYNYVDLTIEFILSAILFFPLFYYAIEWIDLKTPEPKAMKADIEDMKPKEAVKSILPAQQPQTATIYKQNPQNPPIVNQTPQQKNPPMGNYWSDEK